MSLRLAQHDDSIFNGVVDACLVKFFAVASSKSCGKQK